MAGRAITAGIVVLVCWGTAVHAAASADAQITVDVAHVSGTLKPLRGVNGAPDTSFLGATGMLGNEPAVDVSAGYRAAHVNLVRTHDSGGAADIDAHMGTLPSPVGPGGPPAELGKRLDANVLFPDLAADPDSPASYNFGPTDHLIDGIRSIGAQVLFRLGRSGMTTAAPPTDLAKYGDIIRHIVMHYNQGWAGGRHDQIRYWEVWNEPDLGHLWWSGTPEQYYALYETAARAVKDADAHALVGGPTIALVNEPTPFREGFLGFVREHHLPLDFFSWHWYSVDAGDPADFGVIGKRLRQLLNQYGFEHTQSILDEWNYDFREVRSIAPIQLASFVTTALIYMQDAPIDQSALYRADTDFDPSGAPRDKLGAALIEIGRFADSDSRLATRGADDAGLAVQAARSDDQRIVRILLSNYQIPNSKMGPRANGDVMHEHGLFSLRLLPRRTLSYAAARHYTLNIRGLQPGRYQMLTRRLSDAQSVESIRMLDVKGPVKLDFTLPAYVVDSFELTRAP